MSALDTILSALRLTLPTFAKSNGSIEAKIIDIVATYADSEAIERSNTMNVINNALANQRITTRDYYRRKAVAFQAGDVLKYDPVNFGGYYDPVEPENQIVKQAYIVGEYPNYTLLVNAIGADGRLRVMTAEELASFKTYFAAFQPIGLELNINSLSVAKISDPSIVIYVRAGTDSGDAAAKINEALLAYETNFRQTNTVSLSEIEDIIQKYPGVRAVGWGAPEATEQQLDGTTRKTFPERGIFTLTNGAFSFMTEITTDNIKVLT